MSADSANTLIPYDYVVIGAGVSGVYSGWRILSDAKQKDPDNIPSVLIVEQNERVGGRLLSLTPPGIPDARVEIGGMRYNDSQRWISSLSEFLELGYEPLPASRPENIAFVRSTLLRQLDLTDPTKIPYNLAPDERTPEAIASLIVTAATRAIREITGNPNAKPTAQQWEDVRSTGKFHGLALQDLPLRYVLLNTVSHEAFDMQMDTSGYDSIYHTWNAIDGFPWNLADFGHPVNYHHTTDGYDQVPIKLGKLFCELGGDLKLNHLVYSVDRPESGDGLIVKVQSRSYGDYEVYHANKLIVAAPLRSIEILNRENNFFWPLAQFTNTHPIRDLFYSVTPIPLFKLAICYDTPWWEQLPPVEVPVGDGKYESRRITTGKSVTDLPVRQCYYWKTDKTTGNSVILIYDDGVDLDYWAGLRELNQEDLFPFDPKAAGGDKGSDQWQKHPAPRLMVEEVHRQLVELHGLTDDSSIEVPQPYAAAYVDWGEDPYGGGANFWHVGVDSITVGKQIVKPDPKADYYVCGECWSHDQGWVEGALKTAEDMLQKHLGLAMPDWYKPESGS